MSHYIVDTSIQLIKACCIMPWRGIAIILSNKQADFSNPAKNLTEVRNRTDLRVYMRNHVRLHKHTKEKGKKVKRINCFHQSQ